MIAIWPTGVCLHGEGPARCCWWGGMCVMPGACMMLGCVCGAGGHAWCRGACVVLGGVHAGETAMEVGGMQPSEMHSCYVVFFCMGVGVPNNRLAPSPFWVAPSYIPHHSVSNLSPTLLWLGLPWLTGTGDFLSRGWQQLSWWMFMHWATL